MVDSSLTYEILLYLNSFYFGMFMLCELGMAMFKIANFPIPTSNYVSEIVLLIFVCLTESSRIFLGRKGNLTGNSVCLLLSIILLIPSALGVLYFLLWQTYVFRLEAILCYIQLTFQSLQLLFSVTCLVFFYKTGTYK